MQCIKYNLTICYYSFNNRCIEISSVFKKKKKKKKKKMVEFQIYNFSLIEKN